MQLKRRESAKVRRHFADPKSVDFDRASVLTLPADLLFFGGSNVPAHPRANSIWQKIADQVPKTEAGRLASEGAGLLLDYRDFRRRRTWMRVKGVSNVVLTGSWFLLATAFWLKFVSPEQLPVAQKLITRVVGAGMLQWLGLYYWKHQSRESLKEGMLELQERIQARFRNFIEINRAVGLKIVQLIATSDDRTDPLLPDWALEALSTEEGDDAANTAIEIASGATGMGAAVFQNRLDTAFTQYEKCVTQIADAEEEKFE
jgi:hypothetical protein